MNKKEQTARYEIGKVKALIADEIINCTTAILMYVEIKLAAGWTRKVTAKEIYQELGISKASFHRAISKLKTKGWINWTAPDETEFEISRGPKSVADYSSLNLETARLNYETPFHFRDDQTQDRDDQTQGCDDQTQGCNRQALEPAHSKAFTAPSTLSHLYTTYIHREDKSLNANKQPMDLRDPESDEADPDLDPDPTRDPGSDPIRNPDPLSDPGTQFTQGPSSSLHKETMGSLGSNSMSGNSLSSRFDVKQILEETKRKLMEQVQWQRSQRMQRWATSRVSGTESFVLPVGTQGSSSTPDSSDPIMTTTSTFPSSAKPAMLHPSYETPSDG